MSAAQARALLNTVRPRDIVARTRRQLAAELITEVTVIDKKIKAANAQLTELVESTGSRFANRDHLASWNGTAPLDASFGDQRRHRLSRADIRRINRVPHIIANSWPSSNYVTTTPTALTAASTTPDHCIRYRSRSPPQTRPCTPASADVIAAAASSTNTTRRLTSADEVVGTRSADATASPIQTRPHTARVMSGREPRLVVPAMSDWCITSRHRKRPGVPDLMRHHRNMQSLLAIVCDRWGNSITGLV